MGLQRTMRRGNWVLQKISACQCRNDNARRSARAVVQEQNVLRVCTSNEWHNEGVVLQTRDFFHLVSILEHAMRFRLLHEGGLGSCWRQLYEEWCGC